MRGLQISPKRCEIGDDLFFFRDHLCNNGEETAEFAYLKVAELDSNDSMLSAWPYSSHVKTL